MSQKFLSYLKVCFLRPRPTKRRLRTKSCSLTWPPSFDHYNCVSAQGHGEFRSARSSRKDLPLTRPLHSTILSVIKYSDSASVQSRLSPPLKKAVPRPCPSQPTPRPAAGAPFMLVPHSPCNLNLPVRSPVLSRPSRTNRGAFPLAIKPAYHSIIGPPVTYSDLVLQEPHSESLTLLPASGCSLASH
jgi:hypothetical protein